MEHIVCLYLLLSFPLLPVTVYGDANHHDNAKRGARHAFKMGQAAGGGGLGLGHGGEDVLLWREGLIKCCSAQEVNYNHTPARQPPER